MTTAPPVPPASHWPDHGGEQPSSSTPPGWAIWITAAAAVVAVIGGGLIAVRNVGSPPPAASPLDTGSQVESPASPPSGQPSSPGPTLDRSTGPTDDPAEPSASPTITSTFPPLQDVPEVCDLLTESLIARLAPKAASGPGVAKDGYGAKRKDCEWQQKGYNMKGGYTHTRSISVKVNVFPDHEKAMRNADSDWRLMRYLSGRSEGDPPITKYGEIKQISGLGDGACAIYSEGTRRREGMAWIYVVRGNATIEIRFRGSVIKGRSVFPMENSRSVPEAELLKGVEEIAGEAVKNLTG
ncbi:hypothetical protein ACFOY2_22480 [Nonomuraea purpurea]|uniref:DUF3558 domain-containing protein n=1 Tax=Nonomuraea purpurea TaxID=1849276 RepID=A0ABV8GBG9_9ACTN